MTVTAQTTSAQHEPVERSRKDYEKRLARIEKLAVALDSQFTLPGTQFKFGWDSVIGLIPGIGDTITLAPQVWLINEARQLNLGKRVMGKLMFNVGLDFLVGLLPGIGDLFDAVYKSNLRNANIVSEQIRRRIEAMPKDITPTDNKH